MGPLLLLLLRCSKMAQNTSGGWFRSGPATMIVGSMTKSGVSPRTAERELENMSEAGFAVWRSNLEKKLSVDDEKRAIQERAKFKAHEDARFWERQQEMHRQVHREFGNAKEVVEEIRATNRERAIEYREELELMKELVKNQHDEWEQFGRELIVKHGAAQLERTKQAVVVRAEEKGKKGAAARKEEERLKKQLATQRAEALEESRQHVQRLREEKIGKTEESMSMALKDRQEKVESVKRTEAKWKAEQKKATDDFLGHAHENKERAKSNFDAMRAARTALVKAHNVAARKERRRKESDADAITMKRTDFQDSKQASHDKIHGDRRISPDKLRMIKEVTRARNPKKTKQTAVKAGLIEPATRPPPSPYRL